MTIKLVFIDESLLTPEIEDWLEQCSELIEAKVKVINEELSERIMTGQPFEIIEGEGGSLKVVDVAEPPRLVQ